MKNNRMELYNRLEKLLHKIEENEFLFDRRMIALIYREWCNLSNHFGEYEDEKWLEEKIKWYEDTFKRVIITMVSFKLLPQQKAITIIKS